MPSIAALREAMNVQDVVVKSYFMKVESNEGTYLKILFHSIRYYSYYIGMMPRAIADIYINVLAVNGSDAPKNSSIKFDLPGELTAEDILDTNGLQLDYNVDDSAYFVFGDVKSQAQRIQGPSVSMSKINGW